MRNIVERKGIKREDVLSSILDLLCSSIGSLTNPTRVADTINTRQKRAGENIVALNTVKSYVEHLSDAFLFTECKRWDVKGKSYFDYPNKYYCEDIGLRNARIGFRQQELTHIMENIIYNELIIRDCTVDIWVVYSNEKNRLGKVSQVAREIDFIANSGGKKTYIQSAYALGTEEKTITENKPFSLTGDSFPKIIVRHDIRKRWYDENGVLNIGIIDFLLDDTVIWPSKPESNPVQLQEWDCFLEYIMPLDNSEICHILFQILAAFMCLQRKLIPWLIFEDSLLL